MLLVSSVWLIVVNSLEEPQFNKKTSEVFASKLRKMKAIVIKQNKNIGVFTKFKKTYDKRKIYFFYTGYDCESCVEIGYKIVNRVDSLSTTDSVVVITHSENRNKPYLYYNYTGYVYNDRYDEIRSELNFVYTPFMVLLDSNKIFNIYFIQSTNYYYLNYSSIADSMVAFIEENK